MSEPCPNCGYCHACKRSVRDSDAAAAPNPYLVGYACTCGVWVSFGTVHQCRPMPYRQPWSSGTTLNLHVDAT
jgi:hypothetical protein